MTTHDTTDATIRVTILGGGYAGVIATNRFLGSLTDDERRLGILPAGQRPTTNTDIADYSRCPDCVAEADGPGYAARYFNGAGDLWAVCERHGVRWYVTRALMSSGGTS